MFSVNCKALWTSTFPAAVPAGWECQWRKARGQPSQRPDQGQRESLTNRYIHCIFITCFSGRISDPVPEYNGKIVNRLKGKDNVLVFQEVWIPRSVPLLDSLSSPKDSLRGSFPWTFFISVDVTRCKESPSHLFWLLLAKLQILALLLNATYNIKHTSRCLEVSAEWCSDVGLPTKQKCLSGAFI